MARVENVGGIYTSLGYNYDDPNGNIQELSANTQAHLNSAPAFIETWQANDIATGNTGGYTYNPVSGYANTINLHANNIHSVISTANGISGSTSEITNLFSSIANVCNDITGYSYNSGTEFSPVIVTVEGEVSKFNKHTDRLAGTRNYTDDVRNDPTTAQTKPYHDTAIAYGKQVMYITNQTDGITNTSPILGCFTSLMCGPQMSDLVNTISTYAETINASIEYTSTLDGMGNTFTTAASNLSLSVVTTMYNEVSNSKSIMVTRRTHDETFYANQRGFVEKFSQVKKFSSMGESETYLAKNLIGTDKLLERIG